VEIPLEPYRTRLRLVSARVGGQTGRFLLDTAGGLSILTPGFAERIGCEPWGKVTGFRFDGSRLDSPRCDGVVFEVAGLALTAPTAGVIDIMSLLAPGAEPIDGIVALDVFAGKTITIDVAGNRVIVESPASLPARVRGMRDAGAVRLGREVQGAALTVHVPVRLERGTAWFELDSGNGGTVLVGKHIAAALGLDPASDKPQPAHFEVLGGAARVEADAFTPDMILDGNLGMPFLSRYVVTVDLAAAHLWIVESTP
jgi:hypothetical protein